MTAVSAELAPATETSPARPQRAGRLGRALKEAVLTLVGILGLLAIVWLACAMLFGLSIVVFKTGSMAPTIPTGSAAVVRAIAAADIAVGDVITVQREGSSLPVTHRVVAIDANPADAAGRLITLRGDANASNDSAPYPVREAKVVLASAPGFGTALGILRTPFFLALTTLAVALLAIWAFWPQRRQRLHRQEKGARS
jgi:signal peptidase I